MGRKEERIMNLVRSQIKGGNKKGSIGIWLFWLIVSVIILGGQGIIPSLALATNGKIVFVSDRDGDNDIWVMEADGSNPTNITNTIGVNNFNPVWSPDGTKIALQSDRDGNNEIYVMNADGSNVTRLTNHPENDMEPAWSPDGTQIAFASRRDGLISSIYTMDAADGSNVTRITNALPASDQAPAWSPDGTTVAFWTNQGGGL